MEVLTSSEMSSKLTSKHSKFAREPNIPQIIADCSHNLPLNLELIGHSGEILQLSCVFNTSLTISHTDVSDAEPGISVIFRTSYIELSRGAENT